MSSINKKDNKKDDNVESINELFFPQHLFIPIKKAVLSKNQEINVNNMIKSIKINNELKKKEVFSKTHMSGWRTKFN